MSTDRACLAAHTVCCHDGGEASRLVIDGAIKIVGATVRGRRLDAPHTSGVAAAIGAILWHKGGYSTECGHGTIVLGIWASEFGHVDVIVDALLGRVSARGRTSVGKIKSVALCTVVSCVIARDMAVPLGRGPAHVDLACRGAMYASLPALRMGLGAGRKRKDDLVYVSREVRRRLNASQMAKHPFDPPLSSMYRTILYSVLDDLRDLTGGTHQRNVTAFIAGGVDRSRCGGASARAALLFNEDRLRHGRTLVHAPILGPRFTDGVAGRHSRAGRVQAVPEILGMAYPTGHRCFLEPRDPIGTGFLARDILPRPTGRQ